MGFLSSIAKHLNPVKLVSSVIGGTLGKVVSIAANVVTGIAQGKSFGDIMKGVLRDVASLAISAAITYFTGGTASLFINGLLDQAKGILGDVAGKVAASALAKPVSSFLSSQITRFADSLTTDLVRRQLTNVVLDATGLKDEHARLEHTHLQALASGNTFATFLNAHFEASTSASVRSATLETLSGPRDVFEAAH